MKTMSDSVRELLVRGIAAAKAGEESEARFYLNWVIRIDPPVETRLEALYYLCEVSHDPIEQRNFLEEILSNDPTHIRARRMLAILDGKLNSQEIVNPDQMAAESARVDPNDPTQFICPQCGGRMTYTPDGASLTCEYCATRRNLDNSQSGGNSLQGKDFLLTLATSKGHSKPVAMHTFNCQGCGTNFLLSAEILTATCPYCGAAYVIKQDETCELILPDLIIPFGIDEDQAKQVLKSWFKKNPIEEPVRVAPGHAVYLPVWSFEVTGQIPWDCQRKQGDDWVPETGLEMVYHHRILIPATRRIPTKLTSCIQEFFLERAVPYHADYLANWPAETYQISVSDASLDAREIVLGIEKQQIFDKILGQVRNMHLVSTGIFIEAYQLVLIPVWMTNYTAETDHFQIIINGQTGLVTAEQPSKGIRKWLGKILGN